MGHRRDYPKDWRLDAQFLIWCVVGGLLCLALIWAVFVILMALSEVVRT